MPNRAKSQAIATSVMTNVMAERKDARIEPSIPLPRQMKKAMNARPQAIGCRTMTRVRSLVESVEALEKLVLSIPEMTLAGL